jgi:hypothetical protein
VDFESIFFSNNAYKELVKKQDAGSVLLNRFILSKSLSVNEDNVMLMPFELLLSQTVFLGSLVKVVKKRGALIGLIAVRESARRVEKGFLACAA